MSTIRSLISKFWDNQMFRFLVVGGFNTLFSNCIYAIFLLIGLHYTIAVLLALISGVLFNYNTTGRIVFNNKKPELIFYFAGVYMLLYVVNVFLLSLFAQANYNMYIAGAILILPMALLSFFLNKTFVFTAARQ